MNHVSPAQSQALAESTTKGMDFDEDTPMPKPSMYKSLTFAQARCETGETDTDAWCCASSLCQGWRDSSLSSESMAGPTSVFLCPISISTFAVI